MTTREKERREKERREKQRAASAAEHLARTIPRKAKYLRFIHLKQMGLVDNWTTLLRWIEEQGFPAGRHLGPNVRAWTEDEVQMWIASRPTSRHEVIAS
jgi:predicted DNA-binding transcriptional regulator AlpA